MRKKWCILLLVTEVIVSQIFWGYNTCRANSVVVLKAENHIDLSDIESVGGLNGLSEKQRDDLTTEKLNQYIDKLYCEYNSIGVSKSRARQNVVADAWSAAVLILKKNGYPCTAALMECSLNNASYNEGGFAALSGSGLFNKKLKTSTKFINYKKKVRNGDNPKGINFDSKDVTDLYLSLGHVDTKVTSRSITYTSEITDVYDFDYNKYKPILVNLVNNAAWLSQNMNVLHNINVKISTVFK